MRRIILILVSVTLMIGGCSSTPKSYVPAARDQQKIEVANPELSLPSWFLNPPATAHHVIGISYCDMNPDSAETSAKNQAAVILSRNRSSYNVKKDILISDRSDYIEQDSKAQFEVNVSSSPNARKLFDALRCVEDFDLDCYHICLFSDLSTDVDTTIVTFEPHTEPEWIDRLAVEEMDGYVSSVATYRDQDLIRAYEEALIDARLQLARYKLKKVEALKEYEVTDDYSKTHQATAIETVVQLDGLTLNRLHVQRNYNNNLFSYTVHVEMGMEQ